MFVKIENDARYNWRHVFNERDPVNLRVFIWQSLPIYNVGDIVQAVKGEQVITYLVANK